VPADELLDLGFGGATFRWAAPAGSLTSDAEIGGRRIATAYPGVVDAHLAERNIKADVVRLDGAVENAVRLGVADSDRRRGGDRRHAAAGRPGHDR
jgi:ATP phosphoribosyltransferase